MYLIHCIHEVKKPFDAKKKSLELVAHTPPDRWPEEPTNGHFLLLELLQLKMCMEDSLNVF